MSKEPIPPDNFPTGQDVSPGTAEQNTILPINPNNPTMTSARDMVSDIAANQKLQMSEQQRIKLAMRRAKNVEAGAEKNPEKAPTINVRETKPSDQVTRGNSFDKNIIEAYFYAFPSKSASSLSVVILFFLAILITLLTKPKK